MLVFEERRNRSSQRKTSQSKGENQQLTHPTYGEARRVISPLHYFSFTCECILYFHFLLCFGVMDTILLKIYVLCQVRSLYEDFGVSTILVIGGSGDYFQVCKPAVYGIDISYPACVRSGVHMKAAVGLTNSLGPSPKLYQGLPRQFF